MKLLYIMDPLCGWCYGNSANILRLEKELGNRLTIEVLPGGMWIGDRARYQSKELAEFIRSADMRLRAITGIEMTDEYDRLLDESNVLLDSEPGCRAINTVKHINPSLTLAFASALAQARYIDGLDNTLLSTFISIITRLGIDAEEFRIRFESEELIRYTQEIFVRAGEYTHSYPSIYIEYDDGQVSPISLMNYQYDVMKEEIEKYL